MNAHIRLFLMMTICAGILILANMMLMDYLLYPLANRNWINTRTANDSMKVMQTVPVYPGAVFLRSDEIPLRFTSIYYGIWQTTGNPHSIASWYADALVRSGWKLLVPAGTEDTSFSVFYREYNRYVNLSILPDETGNNTIRLELAPKYYPEDIIHTDSE